MNNNSKRLHCSIMNMIKNLVYVFLSALLIMTIEGCDNLEDPVSLGPAEAGPEILVSVLSGAEILAQTKDEADITVFRSLDLRNIVISFSITIPNGYKSAVFNDIQVDETAVLLSNERKTALVNVAVLPWEIQSGVPLKFIVNDRRSKRADFTINPIFQIDLAPEEIASGEWERLEFNYNDDYDSRLLTTSLDNSILAWTGNRINKSSDGGLTWKEITVQGLEYIEWIRLHPSGDLYAISFNKIAKSGDNGETWSVLNTNLPSGSIGGMGFRSAGSMFLSYNRSVDNVYENGIFGSEDGLHWTRVETNNAEGLFSGGEPYYSYLGELAIIDDTTMLMLAMDPWWGDQLLRSDDSGITWDFVEHFSNGGSGIKQILPASDGNVYIAAFNGISISEDKGITWKKINNGIPIYESNYWINGLTEVINGQICVTPKDFGVFLFDKAEARWRSIGTDLSAYNVTALAQAEGKVYAAVSNEGIYSLK